MREPPSNVAEVVVRHDLPIGVAGEGEEGGRTAAGRV